ncbi:MAG: glycosyltransferase family 25 protein [Chitinophagaceae bacterium]
MIEPALFLLSCDGQNERREESVKEIARVFGHRRLNIVTGANKDAVDWQHNLVSEGPEWMRPGEICCASGHLIMAMRFLQTGLPYGLFFEDDIKLLKGAGDYFHAIEAAQCYADAGSDKWHWLNFEFMFPNDEKNRPYPLKESSKPIFRAHMVSFGTACYALTVEGALEVLQQNIPIRMPSDHILRFGSDNNHVFAFNTWCAYADQRGAPSLIR